MIQISRLHETEVRLTPSVLAAGLLLLFTLAVAFVATQVSLFLMLAAAALFGALILATKFPELATFGVLFVLYTNAAAVASDFHGVPQLAAASFFLVLGLPLFIYVFVHGKALMINRVLLFMLAYLVVMLLATLFSEYFEKAAIRTMRYGLEGILLYFLVFNTIRDINVLRKAVWVLILAGCIMGSLTLYQGATHSYGNSFGGFAQVTDARMATGETDVEGDVNRLGLGGPLGEKNHYAQVLAVLLPLAYMRFKAERTRAMKLLALASIIPIAGGVVFTFSRGAALSVLVVLSVMIYLRELKLKTLIVLLLGFIVLVVAVAPDYVYRISTLADLTDIRQADASLKGRAGLSLAVLKLFLDHPVLGVGPGQAFQYTEGYANQEGLKRFTIGMKSHNMYLERLAETGVLGFAVFILILFSTVWGLIRVRLLRAALPDEYVYMATGFLLAIIGYLFHGIFAQLSWERYFWMLLALAAVTCRLADEKIWHPSTNQQKSRSLVLT